MVIPWLGFLLADVIRRAEPMASAKMASRKAFILD